jgi:hypothetical protein
MIDTTLRARNVSELVDAAFALYRRDASAYVMVTAIASVPNLIIQVALLGQTDPASPGAFLANIALMIVSIISYALMTGVVIALGAQVYLGGEADIAGSVRMVIPRIPRLIGAGILRLPLLFLGVLALFFGIFYVLARWFAVEPVIVLEDKDATAAFGRSSELTAGRKWHVLKTLALGFLIYFFASFAAGAIGLASGSEIVLVLVGTVFGILAFPVIGLLTMLLYYDARIRAEGFDLQHMAQSMTPAAATP